jgi:hypothetical protein
MRNNKYILTTGKKILIISDFLNVCLLLYIDRIIEHGNIEEYFKNWCIQEYLEGITLNKNIYFNFQKYCFIDEYLNDISIDSDLSNKINKYIIKQYNKEIGDTQTNLDIFIPLSINETKTENVMNTEFINKLEKENKEIDIDFIRKRIDELTQIKNKENEKINELKNNISEKKEVILKEKCNAQNKKSKLKYEKEKWDELKRKYDINYDIYLKMKEEIKNNERLPNDIPEIFIQEYNIFEEIYDPSIEKNNLFDKYLDEKKKNKNTDLFTKYNNLFEDDNIVISDTSLHQSENSSEDYENED